MCANATAGMECQERSSSLIYDLLRLGFPNHLPHRDFEPDADALERGELQVLLPALQRAVVSAVHLDVIREAFLAELGSFAVPAQDLADADLKGRAFHGTCNLKGGYWKINLP